MNIQQYIQNNTIFQNNSINKTLDLFESGATIPFIARYRKEQTNNLNEVDIALIQELADKYNEITKRKEYILKIINEKSLLSKELKIKIDQCWDLYKLNDYYLPFKTKRITKGEKANKAGLTILAKIIMKHNNDNELSVNRFICKEYNTEKLVIEGALHIIADWINENEIVREKLRKSFLEHSKITTKEIISKKELSAILKQEKQKFKDVLNYSQRLSNCPSHRLLAILRAESKGFINIRIEPNIDYSIEWLEHFYCKSNNSKLIKSAIKDSYKRLLQPSLSKETKQYYKSIADENSILTFSKNLENLLLAPPLGAKSILALDPGFRSGCKLVCIDKSGKLIYNTTIFPHSSKNELITSTIKIKKITKEYDIDTIAIGDGTAGRETEKWIKDIAIISMDKVFMVREDGASIYSASKTAREEFPNEDITVRGAVSIARRLVDPLAELVKIDAKSLGIGQYQHDVNQLKLKKALDLVVQLSVNKVGVNINTASKYLLAYVSGIGTKLAESIVEYREINGLIQSREEIKLIPKMGKKSYEQSAAFLNIPISLNPLDNSSVHPENYNLVLKFATKLSSNINDIISNSEKLNKINVDHYIDDNIGKYTIDDIINELKKPGIDPRQKNINFNFSDNVNSIDDLVKGMIVKGKVTNVTDFGAFINIGIKENGLIHKTELSQSNIEKPIDLLSIGEIIEVKIILIDKQRKRIGLTIKKQIGIRDNCI
jgi:uncharacterized protein